MFSREVHLLPRGHKSSAEIELAWCYPSTYSIGMSGLGYQLIYQLLDSEPDLRPKRAFLDIEEDISSACRAFGFTVSWELDFINVLSMLERHKIPLLSSQRGDEDPIIFAGGPVLTANPEPYADIFDVILMGDAEETIPHFAETLRQIEGVTDRQGKLQILAACPGIYVPALYAFEYSEEDGSIQNVKTLHENAPEHLSKLLFRAPDDYVAHSSILSSDTAWGDVFLMEVARSCPQECRFCLASYLTRPFRTTQVEALLAKADLALQHTRKIGLMGPSITEHPRFSDIVDGLIEKLTDHEDLRVTVASVRADTLNRELVGKLNKLGNKSVTIALESGSERLRRIMKKNLSEAEVHQAVNAIEEGGMTGVKFYLIAGLPYEEWEDVEETVRLLKDLKKQHKRLKLVAGLSSFVPKAQTPFQWKGRDRDAKKKMEHIKKHLAMSGIDVRPESHNWSDIQALLSRGDRRLTEVLLNVAKQGETLGSWRQAMRERHAHVPPLDYYAYRDIPETEILPWSHLAPEERNSYLTRQHEEALQESSL